MACHAAPTHLDAAFVMNQFILSYCPLLINDPPTSSPSANNSSTSNNLHSLLWKNAFQAFNTDKRDYCQQLADVIVKTSNRTTEGKLVNGQLEVFLAACAYLSPLQHNTPSNYPLKQCDIPLTIDALEQLSESKMRQTLTELFMLAADIVFSAPTTTNKSTKTGSSPLSSVSVNDIIDSSADNPSPPEKKRKRRASTSAAVTDTDETSHNPGEETRQLLAKIQKGKHVYLVVEPDESSGNRWTDSLTLSDGMYTSSVDIPSDCVRSSTSVVVYRVSQRETGYYYCVHPTGKGLQGSASTIDRVLWEQETLNLYHCCVTNGTPTTLHELIASPKSNYAAMRALSLAGEYGGNNRPNRDASEPPHAFYFYTSPIGYFLSLVRYAVSELNHANARMLSTTRQEDVDRLDDRVRMFELVIDCLDNITCDITQALATEAELHSPYNDIEPCFVQPTELHQQLAVVIEPKLEDSSDSRTCIDIANGGVLKALAVEENKYVIIEQLFADCTSLKDLKTSCIYLFTEFPPTWEYPSIIMIKA